jgi:transcription antitermination protein NusB
MTGRVNSGSAKGGRHKARRAAVQALYQWQLTGQAPGEIEGHFILDHDVSGVDVEYFHQLVREIPSHQHELDDHISPHLDRAIAEVDPVELACLRIGTYEFEFHPEIPYRVVLNEAVELAKTFGAEHGHKYVNAILDKVAQALRPQETGAASAPR